MNVKSFQGSRKLILKWVGRPDFATRLSELIDLEGVVVNPEPKDCWMPKGYYNPKEARMKQLDKFCRRLRHDLKGEELQNWWGVKKGNTPNWDLVSTCTINKEPGLVLIEAKAHHQELNFQGKPYNKSKASHDKKNNHKHIGEAIGEVCNALSDQGIKISRDSHYQLANRVAVSWKIASMGIHVILVYLGFIGAKVTKEKPFSNDEDWRSHMEKYLNYHVPKDFIEKKIPCGNAVMQMVIRSLPADTICDNYLTGQRKTESGDGFVSTT